MIETLQHVINVLADPRIFFVPATAAMIVAIRIRRLWTIKAGIIMLILVGGGFTLSMFNDNFYHIVTKGDNIPIAGLIFIVGGATWLSLYQAHGNDKRIERGEPVYELADGGAEKDYTWPHLVYEELIVLIFVSVLLLVWSVAVSAPIEQPANPTDTPNPSKAPWYFLGLQEMLVYFDPWMAGVVAPTLIIIGLSAIPYIDKNPKGNGYYCFKDRQFAITGYMFGFLILWLLLIFVGTFLRGPNWNFFGPYEAWDVHKLVPLVNVNLSELIYVKLLSRPLPGHWFTREIFGIGLLGGYYLILPPLLAKTIMKAYRQQIGGARYAVLMVLLLTMLTLPIKMILRWSLNLKYIIAIPEYFLNF